MSPCTYFFFQFFGSLNFFLQALHLDKISVVSSNNQRKFEKGSPGGAWKRNHTLHTYLLAWGRGYPERNCSHTHTLTPTILSCGKPYLGSWLWQFKIHNIYLVQNVHLSKQKGKKIKFLFNWRLVLFAQMTNLYYLNIYIGDTRFPGTLNDVVACLLRHEMTWFNIGVSSSSCENCH